MSEVMQKIQLKNFLVIFTKEKKDFSEFHMQDKQLRIAQQKISSLP